MKKLNENTVLFGFGTVGQGFYNYLVANNNDDFLSEVIIKDATKDRGIKNLNFNTEVDKALNDEEITTIVELISDDKAAYLIVKEALKKGKNVVSANKKMIANHLEEIVKLEHQFGGRFLYEGSVAGSIPIIKIINDHYAYDEITEINGVLNGTCNYILTQIFENGVGYEEALMEAQNVGFAEADPIADVGGYDALYKLLILCSHAFGSFILPEESLNIGIQSISKEDIEFAQNNSLKIKLVANAKVENNKLQLYVLPTFVASTNDLYNVSNEYNGVVVSSKLLGLQYYKGKGAGSFPTGHVVYSDYKSLLNTKYSYANTNSDSSLKYVTNTSIWIYSSKINALEKVLKRIHLLTEESGFGEITIADLINNKEFLFENNISVIAVPDFEFKQLLNNES
jgi:homoserine dehydrogenase